ncbi:lytic polysaccharide monooxygenase [Aspergillus stella-maris]|uniref:lytic polysaccharide monooxygenase n=1 Tax=Aspergillus stella-maris TaxID=1810926 RepID=UPI003CCD7517
MMQKSSTLLAAAGLVSLANAHGYITTPSPRMPGSAMSSACGQQVYNNQNSDRAGNVQGELQVAASQSDYDAEACHIWLCKGYQFDDNTDNVQSYTAGQTVDFEIDIIAPHTGVANVSVVDTASNSVIGSPLISWDVYASTASGVTDDETSFSVTIPDDLGSQCSEAGACVLQWYWFAESIDQTYESCVDFTVGGSGSGSGSGSSGSSSSAASTSTATATATSTASSTTEAATTTTTEAAKTTSTTEAAATTTTTEEAKVPTTLSTATRPTETATETATEELPSAIPTDGTSDEQLNWVSSIIKAVYQYE